ncbi:prion-like-(Q/N-rich) domain-bearing protein 25 [Condylostylus longicornis]|uniref:prion-like-(Q/N-rich) domain-bearing protein 25 n=1 Tax=Condylostylus longicornis TaxID=2530218 RepID=UPI00244DBEE3|nr:prion-like-(Q/N-rich) domain-bearing protein 25 [Condylostylus longicornis]
MATKQILIFTILMLNKLGNANMWFCENNEDCKEMNENAICFKSRCQCPSMQVYSLDKRSCLDSVIYGKPCQESIQCNLLNSKAICSEGVCKCQEHETYVKGKCRILVPLGETCQSTLDCYFGFDRQSVYCNAEKKCDCAEGYYKRHATICRKKMFKANDPCIVHTDCFGLSTEAQCLKNVCVEPKTVYKNQVNNLNKKQVIKLISETKIVNLNETQPKLGDLCNELNMPCQGLSNSICIGHCYCKSGYYPNNEKTLCIAEVGEKATHSEECGNAKGVKFDSSENLCVCENNFFIDEDQKACRKSIVFTAFCTSHGQCSPYNAICDPNSSLRKCLCAHYEEYDQNLQLCVNKKGLGGPCSDDTYCNIENSICSEAGFCVCEKNFFEDNGKCLPGLNATCLSENDCAINNSTCTNNTCNCLNNFTVVDGGCFKIADNVGEYCDKTEQCQHINGICQNNNCECSTEKHAAFGKCYQSKMLQEECASIGECLLKPEDEEGKECRNSKCECKTGFIQNQYEQTCSYNSSTKCISQLNVILSISFLTYFLLKKIF